MGLKEKVIKELDDLATDDLVALSEHIRRLKRTKPAASSALPLEQILRLTASSKSTWSEGVAADRRERG